MTEFFFSLKTDLLLKNRFINYALKNQFSFKIKMVHTTCRNIKALLRVI